MGQEIRADEQEQLLDRLRDTALSPEERADAALAIGDQGTLAPGAIDALVDALSYQGEASGLSEAGFAAWLVWDDVPKFVSRLKSRWRWRSAMRQTWEAYASNPGRWSEIFSVDGWPGERERALLNVKIEAIRSITSREDALALAAELQGELENEWRSLSSSILRVAAAETLGKVGDRRAVPPLIAALEDDDDAVRAAAAEAVGEIGDKRAVGPLKRALATNRLDRFHPPSFGKLADLFPKQQWRKTR